jgi:hypothetical protein
MLLGARFELGGEARRWRARTRRRRRWSVVYLPMTTVRTAVICRYDVTIESPATTNLLGGKTAPQLFNWRARWGSLSCCSKLLLLLQIGRTADGKCQSNIACSVRAAEMNGLISGIYRQDIDRSCCCRRGYYRVPSAISRTACLRLSKCWPILVVDTLF